MVLCRLYHAVCLVLALCLVASSSAVDPPNNPNKVAGGYRVIVRYVKGDAVQSTDDALWEARAQSLKEHMGVDEVEVLPHLAMAVVSLRSNDAQVELIDALEDDPDVELAVIDTVVSATGASPGDTSPIGHRPLAD